MSDFRSYTLGLFSIGGIVFLWVGASFLTRHAYSDFEFQKPFFITYFNTSSFIFFLIPELIKRRSSLSKVLDNKESNLSPTDVLEASGLLPSNESGEITEELRKESQFLQELNFFDTALLSLQFCFQWFLANYLTNLSLQYTSVSSSTILTATSGPFTLLLSHLLSNAHSPWQYSAAFFSFLGVFMIALDDFDPTKGTLLGDFFALTGAIGYAVYATWLPRALALKNVNMTLFLGLLGFFNAACLWPFGLFLHLFKLEVFMLPSPNLWKVILTNTMLGTFLSEWLWLKAIFLTSPFTVTLGLSLTIPIAMLGDILIYDKTVSIWYLWGACMIVLGFIGSQIGDISIHNTRKEELVSVNSNENESN